LAFELETGNLSLIRTGLTKGFYPAFIFSLGCAVGDMVYALWIGGTIMLGPLTFQAFRDTFACKKLESWSSD